VQSDLHQQGKKEGYRTTPHTPRHEQWSPAEEAEYNNLRDELVALQRRELELQGEDGTLLPDVTEADILAIEEQMAPIRGRLRELNPAPPPGVPDMPFKDSWIDLALKQHLMQVAEDPKLTGLAVATPRLQDDLWGTQRIQWKQHPEGGYNVEFTPQVGGKDVREHANLFDEQDLTPHPFHAQSVEDIIKNITERDGEIDPNKVWKRMTGAPEGIYEPRKVGMEVGYGEAMRNRLQKLLKPFGATVEEGTVPAPTRSTRELELMADYRKGEVIPRTIADVTNSHEAGVGEPILSFLKGTTIKDAEKVLNQLEKRSTTQEGIPAWIARLTPEQKQMIKEKGFPALLAILAAQQSTQQPE
jgi:hypothetical protein